MPNSEDLAIRRCVCGETTFVELKRLGVRTLDDAAQLGCGVGCGLCQAYIERMIATGEIAFAAD